MTRTTGIVMIVVGVLSGLVLRFVDDAPVAVYFLPAVLLVLGGFTFYRGRQLRARASVPDLDSPGPRVLYLRAFTSDPSVVKQSLLPLLNAGLLSGLTSEEEQLAEVLVPFGRMVAIGRPGESLPAPGAARAYVPDEQWQAVVDRQMRLARLVVIRIGSSEGLRWELHRAREIVAPTRLLLLVSGLKRRDRPTVSRELRSVFGIDLPGSLISNAFVRRTGFYAFSPTWEPRYLPARPPFLRRSSYKYFRVAWTFALRPIFELFHIEWVQPRVSRLLLSSMVLLGILVLFFLVGIVIAVSG